jgi:glucose-6-phosphate isomerase
MKNPINVIVNDTRMHGDAVSQGTEKLCAYLDTMKKASSDSSYSFLESSIFLPKDTELVPRVKHVIGEKIKQQLPKYIIVVGIGGSNLGTKAVYDALFGYYDILETKRRTTMLFLDTVDALFLQKTENLLRNEVTNPNDILIFVISKSGGTTETTANIEILLSALKPTLPSIIDRVVAISDEHALLHSQAQAAGVTTLTLPDKVGGRYSVLSAVGLAPLFACGIDIDALMQGASDMEDACLSHSFDENPAFRSAIALSTNMGSGHTIHDTFVFAPSLESLGKWYRQLTGESVGKEKDWQGNIVHRGITPTVSVGSTDLHSVGQLYLGGPKDKITSFVSLENYPTDIPVPGARVFPELVKMIQGKSIKNITEAILLGVKESYRKNDVPFMTIVLDDISPRSLGAFFQWKMMEIIYLGNLLNVNPFDQPNVESYKIETKAILEA